MIFRDATERDALSIAELQADSWRSAYREILSHEYLENRVGPERVALWQARFAENAAKRMFVIVADPGDELAGFVCVFPEEDPVFGSFLDNLHIAPQRTGQGIGRLLLGAAASRLVSAKKRGGLYLWVMEQNARARQFYVRAGAAEVETAVLPMPDGGRHPEIRCYWPDPSRLVL